MTINQRKEGNIIVLELRGRLDLSNTQELDSCMVSLIGGGILQIVLDLSGLEYVSSAGLRIFLVAAKRMRQSGGKLVLANPAPQVKQVLEVSGFSTFLPIYSTVSEAVGSCVPTPAVVAHEIVRVANFKLTVAEEIYLLALDDTRGIIRPLPDFTMDYALASALLMELELFDRIDTDLTMLKVASTAPTGEPLLDDALLELLQKSEPQPISFWLERLATQKGQIGKKVLAQLIRKGILKEENRRIFLIFKTHRYTLMDDREVKEVRTRLRELILSDDLPDARDVVLISLGNACRLLEYLFKQEEKDKVRSRIASLARLDLISHALDYSISEVERKVAVGSMPQML